MNKWNACVETIDNLLKTGKGSEARKLISKINISNIPRPYRFEISNLAMRSNLPFVSVRVMHKIIYPGKKVKEDPTSEEKSEYAFALSRVGASDEAIQILKSVDKSEYQKKSLYQAFVLISQWDYKNAGLFLKEYLSSDTIEKYSRFVAQLNLGACYLFDGNIKKAESTAKRVIEKATEEKLDTLLGNAYELLGQISFEYEDWDQADYCFEQSMNVLNQSESSGLFFSKKWKIFSALRRNKTKASVRDLDYIRKKALELGHWETLRDCDYQEALVTKNTDLIHKVYLGTPYQPYRLRVRDKFSELIECNDGYIYHSSEKEPKRVFDLQTAVENESVNLKQGKSLHLLLQNLMCDFYRPMRVAMLFSKIYQGEYFNPETAPNRIHQLIKRLREWTIHKKVPLKIEDHSGGYVTQIGNGYGIKIFDSYSRERGFNKEALILKNKFKGKIFSAKEASKVLNVTHRQANNILKNCKKIDSIGKGPSTKYKFSA